MKSYWRLTFLKLTSFKSTLCLSNLREIIKMISSIWSLTWLTLFPEEILRKSNNKDRRNRFLSQSRVCEEWAIALGIWSSFVQCCLRCILPVGWSIWFQSGVLSQHVLLTVLLYGFRSNRKGLMLFSKQIGNQSRMKRDFQCATTILSIRTKYQWVSVKMRPVAKHFAFYQENLSYGF